MKKTMIIFLVVALLATALTGCGRRNDTVEPTPGINNNDNTVVPEDNNGVVNDGNGIIGNNATDTDVPGDSVLPEIGNDIEQGVDDVIDGVGDAIEGNDNNAASGNTAGDNARGRARMR